MTTAPDVHWESWRRLRDPASFEALVRPELGRALSFARSLGCSDADAEDVLQESLVRLAAERSDGPSRIGVRAWLYRTVRDRARSRRRSWWRRRDREARAARPEAAPARTGELEVREQVEQALAALPDAEREAVRLRYLQDLDYRDMAHVLGVSENACRIRVHRALESLKKRFGEGAATMVAALPLPESRHLDHVVGEVLRQSVPAAAKAGVAAGWKVLGGAVAVVAAAGVATFVLPGPSDGPRRPRQAAPLPGSSPVARTSSTGPDVRSSGRVPEPGPEDSNAGTPSVARPTSAAPEPPPPPPRSPPTREDRTRSTLADVVALLEPVAGLAWDRGLPEAAADVYRRILDVDPAHGVARQRADTKKEDTSRGEKYRREIEKQLAAAYEKAARILAELGVADEAAGDAEAAQKRWALALEFHDQDTVANERMGNKLVAGRWYTPRGLAHRDWWKAYEATLAGAKALEFEPMASAATTGIAEAAGVPIGAWSTGNFRIEGNLPDEDMREILIGMERARHLFLELFEVPARMVDYSPDPLVYVLVQRKEEYDRLVESCEAVPEGRKSFLKKFTSIRVTGRLSLATAGDGASARRHCIHAAVHALATDAFGRHAPWLYEAVANAVSAAIQGSELLVCFSGEGSTGGIHFEPIPLERAPPLLRDMIRARKDDGLGELVRRSSDELSAPMVAKAWSILQFLLETDRGQAREYLAAAGQGTDGDRSRSEKVLKTFFPGYATWKDLDAAWRAWALDVYRK